MKLLIFLSALSATVLSEADSEFVNVAISETSVTTQSGVKWSAGPKQTSDVNTGSVWGLYVPNIDCHYGDGAAYRGSVKKTKNGNICQKWSSQSPNKHKNSPEQKPNSGLEDNYCRNPNDDDSIWCYTVDGPRWEYCDIPSCPAEPPMDCYPSGESGSYLGTVSTTNKGHTCQAWDSQSPNTHKNSPEQKPDAGLEYNNYCRDPDGENSPWCYTVDGSRWEFCGIPVCPDVETAEAETNWTAGPKRATDGNTNTSWDKAGCAYTDSAFLNWWQITLDKSFKIDHVVIFGLSDKWGDGEGLLNGARLIIGGQLCEVISGMEVNPTEGHMLTCVGDTNKRLGKVVRLENWGRRMVLCEVQVMVRKEDLTEEMPTVDPDTSIGQEIDDFYNVAYKKPTSGSSVKLGGSPSRAVDGWADQSWSSISGSCSHTDDGEQFEYWKVDLGRVYKIDHILVYNRNDGSSSRLNGAMLFVDEILCTRLTDTGKKGGWMESIKCGDLMSGRFIVISLWSGYLSLCEVQVMVKKSDIDFVPTAVYWPGERVGNFTNVAFDFPLFRVAGQGTASQSSAYSGNVEDDAWRANDGISNGDFKRGSVTHTNKTGHQWWEVDLRKRYKIHHITVYGRSDREVDRIEGTRVFAGQTQVGGNLKTPAKPTDPITVEPRGDVYASKVLVDIVNQFLSVAEVQVWVANEDVYPVDPPPTLKWENVAVRRPTEQSSTYDSRGTVYIADRAVYNYAKYLSHTKKEDVNWWQVNLETEYYIDHIVVYGRTDNNQQRLYRATLEIDGRTVAGFNYKVGVQLQSKWEFMLYGYKGRVVRITKKYEYLTLAEVQVMVNHEYKPVERVEPIDRELNLAKTARASSLSSLYGTGPGLVNDGNIDADYFRGSCYLSGPAQNRNWLKLELKEENRISSVTIYPRLDYHASVNIDGAEVRVGKHLCGTIRYGSGALFYEFDCQGATGSQVTVSKLGFLSICEVVINPLETEVSLIQRFFKFI